MDRHISFQMRTRVFFEPNLLGYFERKRAKFGVTNATCRNENAKNAPATQQCFFLGKHPGAERCQTTPHCTAPHGVKTENQTSAPHRTVRLAQNTIRSAPHSGVLRVEKPHRGLMLHRENP